ncbi:MAG: hypothetical protein UV60_C0002G0080 [Parcubacteria group bacterium GW2011_GWA2_43_11]|nr:MAG: hypothetical protein UV60_C0002G0080 [Parcubacteria group bacterium GW2011_GWA2_43_11]
MIRNGWIRNQGCIICNLSSSGEPHWGSLVCLDLKIVEPVGELSIKIVYSLQKMERNPRIRLRSISTYLPALFFGQFGNHPFESLDVISRRVKSVITARG